MLNAILGKKINQTQEFVAGGKRLPVTVIEAGPCPVVQIKTKEKDGYTAFQIGFGVRKTKLTKKPIKGHIRGAKLETAPRFLREIRLGNGELENGKPVKLGDLIKVGDIFHAGDEIKLIGVSKGKGFAGVVKRWGFHGGPRTHGQSDRERAPGSIGSTTTPGRVYKGKKMAGRMGQDQVTIKGIEVIEVNPEKNLLKVKGLVPGARNGLVVIYRIKQAERVDFSADQKTEAAA